METHEKENPEDSALLINLHRKIMRDIKEAHFKAANGSKDYSAVDTMELFSMEKHLFVKIMGFLGK